LEKKNETYNSKLVVNLMYTCKCEYG